MNKEKDYNIIGYETQTGLESLFKLKKSSDNKN